MKSKLGVPAGVMLLLVALGTATGVAHAQDGEGNEAGVFDQSAVESDAPGEDLDRKIRALRWGVAASTVVIPLGLGLFVGGSTACIVNGVFHSSCTRGQNAAQGVGLALSALGTAGMITSAILLHRRKQERRGLHAGRRLQWSHTTGSFVF